MTAIDYITMKKRAVEDYQKSLDDKLKGTDQMTRLIISTASDSFADGFELAIQLILESENNSPPTP